MTDLRLSLYGSYDAGDNRHAQVIMRELGITYLFAIPQSIADQWWFLCCENVPGDLPNFITHMEVKRLSELIGYGLDRKMADEIKVWRKHHMRT